jgi:hypothetical protein
VSDDAKRERQRALVEALHPPGADDEEPRQRLEQILSADELRALDKRVLDAVVAEREPEPEPVPFFDAVAAARSAQKRTLIDVVRGRQPGPDPSTPPARTGWDGGVRGDPGGRRPETHEETLVKLLRSREADAGHWL